MSDVMTPIITTDEDRIRELEEENGRLALKAERIERNSKRATQTIISLNSELATAQRLLAEARDAPNNCTQQRSKL